MKTASVSVSDIKCQDRYEPEYWIISDRLHALFEQHQWHVLDEDARFVRKGIFDLKAERYQNFGIPFLRISNLKYFELDKSGMVFISEEDNAANKKTMLVEGDIAFSKIGTLGKILRVSDEYKCVNLSQNLIGVGLKKEIDKNYIFAFLLSRCALMQINKNRKKQLQDKLNLNDVKDIRIIDVSPEDKSKVSDLVGEAVNITSEINQLIKEARTIFYSRIKVDFDSVHSEKFFSVRKSDFVGADLWTPEFSSPLHVGTNKLIRGNWEVVSIGEITELIKGDEVGSENYVSYLEKKDTDVPFIRTSDIVNYETDQYPDYFVPGEIYRELAQDIKVGDILFSKDGKIGQVGMITQADRAIIASGFCALRLNKKAEKYGLTQEYLFTVLSIREIGIYESKRRTVVASTIPHLREERVKEMEIPVLDKAAIDEITTLVREAFRLKAERKELIAQVRKTIDSYFDI